MLTERVPERAQAHGKQLFVHVDDAVWQIHLGLYGAFSFRGDEQFAGVGAVGAPRAARAGGGGERDDEGWIVPEAPQGAVRARVRGRDGWADLRGPAVCRVVTYDEHLSVLERLGPDPLRQAGLGVEEAPFELFLRRLARRRVSIGAALMDQAVIAGVGNIYRAESLFLERMSPHAGAAEIPEQRVRDLWTRLTRQMRDGVAEGAIRTLRPGAGAAAGPRPHWVYKHEGTACLRCAARIRAEELQGRRLYWCPGCQVVP